MKTFEINCDLGEKTGNDVLLMPYLDACSIACGGHIGDEHSMHETVLLAKKNKVKVGAHPSFPDKENFGRKAMKMNAKDLTESLRTQIDSLVRICKELNVELDHVKPHGALYNLAARDKEASKAILDALKDHDDITLLAPWRSVTAKMAMEMGVKVRLEGFADRRYTSDLQLVSRSNPDAVITDPDQAVRQVLSIFKENKVESIDGKVMELHAETFCIHGDNPATLVLVKALNEAKHAKAV